VLRSLTTRCNIVSGPKGNIALGAPIGRFPPHRTIPPASLVSGLIALFEAWQRLPCRGFRTRHLS
jgi:hypothetical protein